MRAYENYLSDRLDPAVRKYWELEDPVEINGQMVDLHDWVTLPWDADWYKDDTEGEYVDPLEREPRPAPEPVSVADIRAEAFFDQRRAEEQRMWDEARADIGLIVPLSMKNDYRIKGEWDEEKLTKEELDELIGSIPNPSPLQVLNPFRTVQHDEGDPDGPDTMIDWMRSEGLLLENGYSSDEEYTEGDEEVDPEKWIGDGTVKWMAREEAGEDEIIGDDDDWDADPTATAQDVERFERGQEDYDDFLQGQDDGGFD